MKSCIQLRKAACNAVGTGPGGQGQSEPYGGLKKRTKRPSLSPQPPLVPDHVLPDIQIHSRHTEGISPLEALAKPHKGFQRLTHQVLDALVIRGQGLRRAYSVDTKDVHSTQRPAPSSLNERQGANTRRTGMLFKRRLLCPTLPTRPLELASPPWPQTVA